MSDTKHTPGPWVWNGKHGSLHRAGEAPYRFGEVVLRPTWEYDEGSDIEINDADASLIAAAPDMLAALKEAHSALDRALGDTDISYIETDEELRAEEPVQWAAMRIFNAIAKAETPGTSRD